MSISNPMKQLPSVTAALDHPGIRLLVDELGRDVIVDWLRTALDELRGELENFTPDTSRGQLVDVLAERLERRSARNDWIRMGRVINATGVILHTGLGRAPLAESATSALADMTAATNLEIDLASGERRHRGYQVRDTWTSLTGCEDVLVVNNNAAATLLTLQALCHGREVIISRGQLIEIGGAFRLPEIFELSGAKLREVGTTNRTSIDDYRRAINDDTAAIMHVHPSNYRVVGFSHTPDIAQLVSVTREHNLLAIDDIGSGSLVDIAQFGLPAEPTFCDSIAAGADIVLGSGDKLLGGPQAGVILGQANWVEQLRQHPLARAIRVGKLTLAALAATLAAYQRGTAQQEIPVLAMLSASPTELLRRADHIVDQLGHLPHLNVSVRPDTSPVGGGSVPAAELPTAVICLTHPELSAETLAQRLRLGQIRLYARIQNDQVLVDLRSVATADDSKVELALRLIGQDPHESEPHRD